MQSNMENENQSNVVSGKEEGENLLSTHTVTSIIDLYKNKQDCTDDLVNLIKSNIDKQKKLLEIFKKVENYNLSELLELSNDKIRNYRHIVTYLFLSKSLVSTDMEFLEIIFENIVFSRINDVDSSIKILVIRFLGDLKSDYREDEVIKALFSSLNSKNDNIRKKSIQALHKKWKYSTVSVTKGSVSNDNKIISSNNDNKIISSNNENKIISSNNDNKIISSSKWDKIMHIKKKILWLGQFDKNVGVRIEATKFCMTLFLEKQISDTELFLLIKDSSNHNIPNSTTLINSVFRKLCPDGLNHLERFHEIFKKVSPLFFNTVKINFDLFLEKSNSFIKSNSNCCDSDYFCLFSIWKSNDSELTLQNFHLLKNILETCKDNEQNVIGIIEMSCRVKNFVSNPEDAVNLFLSMRNLILTNFEPFIILLKNNQEHFNAFIQQQIDFLLQKRIGAVSPLIKHFDVTKNSFLNYSIL